MHPRNSSAHASGDDGAGPSSMGGGDFDVLLHIVAQRVMAKITQNSREREGPSADQGCTIEKFTKMNPLAFSGGAGPTVAENWVQEMKKILTVLHCANDQRVMYATYELTSEAERWWTIMKFLEEQRLVPTITTWSRFKEIFFDRYFPTTIREANIVEFLNLT
ncbi:uncharacterized protein LOC131160781 [Malania oleifera]|uniref:uncharacterized protein LOC131160781 n=1 Tax=Malania oleifera TaxID=397392 RepID=UPI0025AECD22|nr:uncharacterized protein LOC131160781 [Malania oleifera]